MDFMLPIRLVLALCALSAFAAEAPKLRLPDDIRPVKYAADLTLVPGDKTFAGAIDIDISLAKPASLIWLNATELTIQQATIASQPATIEPGNGDFVGLRAANILAPGPAHVHIVYQGKISEKSSAGIFQGLDGKQPYLFTQFESTDARRAFPCFDQPDFKAPWQITAHIPKDHAAVSNTSPVSQTDEPNGMKKVVFAPTRPLSSYLVAIAVGPFDFVDAGKAGKNHIPVRIVTPKGKAGQAKYAAEVTATIIDRLENYFGIPFPFEKCDNVAIPLTHLTSASKAAPATPPWTPARGNPRRPPAPPAARVDGRPGDALLDIGPGKPRAVHAGARDGKVPAGLQAGQAPPCERLGDIPFGGGLGVAGRGHAQVGPEQDARAPRHLLGDPRRDAVHGAGLGAIDAEVANLLV